LKATEQPRPDNGQEIEDREQEGYCNPLNSYCETCPDLQDCEKTMLVHSVRIPQWMIDDYLSKMSGTDWKLFTYLFRKATFQEGHRNFGRCFPSKKEIHEKTGIGETNIYRHIQKLEDLGLIECKNVPRPNKDGKIGSFNQYKILWFQRKKELQNALKKLKTG
jgi:hypothetical protein